MIIGNIYSIRTNGGNDWKWRSILSDYHMLDYESYELMEQILMRKTKVLIQENVYH